jgi:lipoprotein-anchoring transpeptidase ErfK/SrfK
VGPIRQARLRTAATAAAAALTALLTACSGAAPAATHAAGGEGQEKERPATVTVTPHGGRVRAGEPVRVVARGGTLTAVTVTGPGGGLTGTLSTDRRTWTSDRNVVPGASYTVEAATRTGGGTTGKAESSFTTAAAGKVNKVDWRPGDNTTVGVAQPISLVFDNPVTDKAAVEKQLEVTTSNGTEGSWGWLTDYSGRDRVDWRPRDYWRPGTKVTLNARLNGTDSGPGGGWFVRDYKAGFTVGARQVVKVDLDSKRLTLQRDGRTVRTVPVSGGTPGPDTGSWRGTAVVLAKEGTVRMNSETVGLGKSYDEMVDDSIRLTWSGMYAHAAPWNAAFFGRANRSHGCVGMSDADADWLYSQVRVGDPFEIKGAEAKGTVAPNNGFGDWNLDWDQWRAKSALH